MWIFTTSGFISAVSNSDGTLKVRARDKASLKALAKTFNVEIKHTPVADYPYRLRLEVGQFSEWVRSEALNINYRNFKSAAEASRGSAFASALNKVWSVMHDVEDVKARSRNEN